MNKLKERKDWIDRVLNTIKKVIYILILCILLPALITELYLRYIGLGDPIRYSSDYVYGYAPKENQKKSRIKNAEVTINDVGLRSLFDWKNSKEEKILFMGDSVTYGGSYIDDHDIFSNLVCSQNKFEKLYLCGNAGVNSYGIFNIVFRSRYDQRIQDYKIIVFNLVPDDFYRGLKNSETAHFYLNNKIFPFPAIVEAINFIAVKYDINKFISKLTQNEKIKNKDSIIDESINILISEINRIENLNKKILLTYSPSFSKNGSISKESKYIYKKLVGQIDNQIISFSKTLNKEMLEDSVHYNKKGHKAVADKIILEIKKKLNAN